MRSAAAAAWHALAGVTRGGLRRYVGLGRIGLQVVVAGGELGIGLLHAVETVAADATGAAGSPAAAEATVFAASPGEEARPTGDATLGQTDRARNARHSSSPGAAAAASAAVSAPPPSIRVADGHASRPPLSEAPAPSARVSEQPTLVAAVAEAGAEDGPGAEIRIDEPWPGYRSLRAPEVIDRLVVADVSELAVIELYERAHRSRSSVLLAAERELASRSSSARRGASARSSGSSSRSRSRSSPGRGADLPARSQRRA